MERSVHKLKLNQNLNNIRLDIQERINRNMQNLSSDITAKVKEQDIALTTILRPKTDYYLTLPGTFQIGETIL